MPTEDFIPNSCVSFHSNNSEFLQLIFRAFVLHFENLCECFGFEKKNQLNRIELVLAVCSVLHK